MKCLLPFDFCCFCHLTQRAKMSKTVYKHHSNQRMTNSTWRAAVIAHGGAIPPHRANLFQRAKISRSENNLFNNHSIVFHLCCIPTYSQVVHCGIPTMSVLLPTSHIFYTGFEEVGDVWYSIHPQYYWSIPPTPFHVQNKLCVWLHLGKMVKKQVTMPKVGHCNLWFYLH